MINKDKKIIQSKINEILSNQQDDFITISETILNEYKKTLKIISDFRKLIFEFSCTDDYIECQKQFDNVYLMHKNDIENIEYLITGSDSDFVKSIQLFDKMKHNYYIINNLILESKNNLLIKKIESISKKLDHTNEKSIKLENMSNKIEKQYETIGSTILTIVLSVTVVTTSITAISRINAVYIPLFIVGIVWLAMTLIVFITDLFKYKEENSKQAISLYGIISLLMLFMLFYTYSVSDQYVVPLCETHMTESSD